MSDTIQRALVALREFSYAEPVNKRIIADALAELENRIAALESKMNDIHPDLN